MVNYVFQHGKLWLIIDVGWIIVKDARCVLTCLEEDPEIDLAIALEFCSVSTREVAFSWRLVVRLPWDLLRALTTAALASWCCCKASEASTISM